MKYAIKKFIIFLIKIKPFAFIIEKLFGFYRYKRFILKQKYSFIRRKKLNNSPFVITHELTLRCSANCMFCYQRPYRSKIQNEISFKDLILVYNNIFSVGINRIDLIGGEIFLREDIFDIINLIEEHKCDFTISTSGVNIDDNAIKKLISYTYLKNIYLSIEGKKEVNDLIRGKGNYKRNLYIANSMLNTKKVNFTTTISKMNLKHLDEAFDVQYRYESNRLICGDFFLQSYSTIDEVKETQEILKKNFGWNNTPIAVQVLDHVGYSYEELKNALFLLRGYAHKKGRLTLIHPSIWNFKTWDYYMGTECNVHCPITDRHEITIDEKGNVIFCSLIRHSFGSLRFFPLLDIYEAKEFREFRDFMRQGLKLPICRHCHCLV